MLPNASTPIVRMIVTRYQIRFTVNFSGAYISESCLETLARHDKVHFSRLAL